MIHSFQNKTIVIFSPQPWNHISISKHHYALTLSKKNAVYFISAPGHQLWNNDFIERLEKSLFIIKYGLNVPEWLKFKAAKLYQFFVKRKIGKLFKKRIAKVDYIFDFGCYQMFDSTAHFPAEYRIFFPVDDFLSLKDDLRGAHIAFTVSSSIHEKFSGKPCFFINHGLSDVFVKKATQELESSSRWQTSDKIKVGYAGNIFLRFIDFEMFEELIRTNPTIEFHFFGNADFDFKNNVHQKWNSFINNSHNVKLRGWLSANELVEAYLEMDLFLVCYKADNLNYHGENSHKILEYLSTGKVIVTSPISLYENTELLEMTSMQNSDLLGLFRRVVTNLPEYNSLELMQKRRKYAILNSYEKQLERIENILNHTNQSIPSR